MPRIARPPGNGFENWLQAFRFAARGLCRAPGFSLAVVCSLVVCIGPNAATLSALYALVLKPLPFPESGRLVTVVNVGEKSGGQLVQSSTPQYRDIREHASLLAGVAGLRRENVTLDDDTAPMRVGSVSVCGELFGVLGLVPLRGRFFQMEDEAAGRDRVVVLSEGFWRSRYHADEEIVGQTVRINLEPYTVVGVAPASIEALCPQAAFFMPYVPARSKLDPQGRYRGDLVLYARLKPGVPWAAGQAQLSGVEAAFLSEQATPQVRAFVANAGFRLAMAPVRPGGIVAGTNTLWLLQGGALLVLLIGAVNVTNLFLARMNAKRAELAVRVALGAGRGALLRQTMAESLLLTGASALVGLLVAAGALRGFNLYLPIMLPSAPPVAVDLAVAGAIALAALAIALAVAIVPLQMLWRGGLHLAGSRAVSPSGRSRRLSGGLVVVQIAIAVVLLVGAGLLLRSFGQVMAGETGFDAAQVVRGRVDLPRRYAPTRPLEERYRDPGAGANLAVRQRIAEAIGGIPGVASVAESLESVVIPNARPVPFTTRSAPDNGAGSQPLIHIYTVSPEFFATMGMRVLSGRGFTGADDFSRAPVAVVDETFARRYFPDRPVEGQEIFLSRGLPLAVDGWPRIVGVVSRANFAGLDSHDNLPIVFVPTVGFPVTGFELLVRSSRSPADLVRDIRTRLHEIDPALLLHSADSLEAALSALLLPRRGITWLLAVFSGLALVLAGVGLYGVLSYDVSQRTREIGIRGAIGASRRQILALILRQGMVKLAVGLGLGVGGAVFSTRYLSGFLFGIVPADPLSYGVVIGLLAAVALLACWLPARRAARVDPIVALRSE